MAKYEFGINSLNSVYSRCSDLDSCILIMDAVILILCDCMLSWLAALYVLVINDGLESAPLLVCYDTFAMCEIMCLIN